MAISRCFAAALLAIAAPASAADYVVNAVINSNTLLPGFLNSVAIDPISLGVGDTLDLKLTFSGGSLALNGGTPLWTGLLTSGDAAGINVTSTLTIIGGSANLVTSAGPLMQLNQFSHVGSYFFNGLVQTAPGPISFTGLNQFMTIDSDDIGMPREYGVAFFYYEGAAGPAVPEPASWAMMITGFGLVGAVARRRRNRPVMA
jgi:hypothetical protein